MLTLAKVVSAESAASYYEGSDDYYSEDGRAPSAWRLPSISRTSARRTIRT